MGLHPVSPGSSRATLYDSGYIAAAVASFDVQNLSPDFFLLEMYLYARGTTASVDLACNLKLNNDGGANYDSQYVAGVNVTASAGQVRGGTAVNIGNLPGSTADANRFGLSRITVPMYSGTVNFKIFQYAVSEIYSTTAASGVIVSASAQWRSAAAVNRVTVTFATGNFDVGSRLVIVGVG